MSCVILALRSRCPITVVAAEARPALDACETERHVSCLFIKFHCLAVLTLQGPCLSHRWNHFSHSEGGLLYMCFPSLMDVLRGLPPALEGEISKERKVLIPPVLQSVVCVFTGIPINLLVEEFS